jgi:hypothetical protein
MFVKEYTSSLIKSKVSWSVKFTTYCCRATAPMNMRNYIVTLLAFWMFFSIESRIYFTFY